MQMFIKPHHQPKPGNSYTIYRQPVTVRVRVLELQGVIDTLNMKYLTPRILISIRGQYLHQLQLLTTFIWANLLKSAYFLFQILALTLVIVRVSPSLWICFYNNNSDNFSKNQSKFHTFFILRSVMTPLLPTVMSVSPSRAWARGSRRGTVPGAIPAFFPMMPWPSYGVSVIPTITQIEIERTFSLNCI